MAEGGDYGELSLHRKMFGFQPRNMERKARLSMNRKRQLKRMPSGMAPPSLGGIRRRKLPRKEAVRFSIR